MSTDKWLRSLLSVVGVPCVFAAYVEIAYKIALGRGRLPLAIYSLPAWLVAVTAFTLVGCYVAYPIPSRRWRIVFLAGYVPLLIVAMLFVQAQVACANGDCL